MEDSVLKINNLKKYFPVGGRKNKNKYVKAINNIDITLKKGETLGLVGESGSGKSTTAYTIIGMHNITSGNIIFNGEDIGSNNGKRSLNMKKEIQMVFQDPGTSLNPQKTVYKILELPLKIHKICPSEQYKQEVIRLMDMVELPIQYLYKYPDALGGGEKQMVAIARALATRPSIIVLDEPTSALDVSVQAKIINMLLKLKKEMNLSYLFITHDLSLMRNVADRVAIMYLGKIAEIAPTKEFFDNPRHPYTKMLLSSIPVVTEEEEKYKPKKILSKGEIPSPVNVPEGCSFNTRCTFKWEKCLKDDPKMIEVGPEHKVRCHLCEKKINYVD